MRYRNGNTVLVAGGTGNVGGFIVDALLRSGATVMVPSRSEAKLDGLRSFLSEQGRTDALDRLVTQVGDLATPRKGAELLNALEERGGPLDAALASLGHFRPAKSLLSAPPSDLQAVLDGYLGAHMRIAQAVIPRLKDRGGRYVFVNGPLAFDVWPGSSAGLVSIATAAQHMLFKALAQELSADPVLVTELVIHAFIRNRTAQPGSPLSGEEMGGLAARLLLSPSGHDGETLHARKAREAEVGGARSASNSG